MKKIIRTVEMLKEYPLIMLAAAAVVFYLTDCYAREIRAVETIGNAFVISVYGNLLGMVIIAIGLIAAETKAERKREERAYRDKVRSLRRKYADLYNEVYPCKNDAFSHENMEQAVRRGG